MPTQPLPSRNQMLGFILRFIQDGNRGDEVTVKREFRGDFLVLFGIIQRVRRLSQSWIRLEKAGFGTEARMLVRAAIARRDGAMGVLHGWGSRPDASQRRPRPVQSRS
jgi:hypothetical protein